MGEDCAGPIIASDGTAIYELEINGAWHRWNGKYYAPVRGVKYVPPLAEFCKEAVVPSERKVTPITKPSVPLERRLTPRPLAETYIPCGNGGSMDNSGRLSYLPPDELVKRPRGRPPQY